MAGAWCAVDYAGKSGFVSGKYLNQADADTPNWPRAYDTSSGGQIVLYQPQVSDWTGFANLTALVASEYKATKDPLNYFQNALVAEKVLTDELIAQIDESARAEAETSAQFAEASPFPTVEDVQKDVYWEADNPADRKSQGTLFFN